MALSRIWSGFIIVAIVVAGVKCFFFGQSEIFSWMVVGKADDPSNLTGVNGIIETCWTSVELCLKLIGILALFMGFMSIAERAGGIRLLSRIVGPFFSKLFPEIPKGHPSMGHMIMNFSANLLGLDNAATPFGLKATVGASFFYAKKKQDDRKFTPLFTEKYTVNWAINYEIPKWFLSFDYTGNLTGSMRLPLLGELDPRREYSLPFSIQNIQITYKKIHDLEIYSGVKNLFNWTPNRGNPFIIARSHDPFDENVQFDTNGNVIPTADNPYGLTFDPTYAYGPNQGIRFFLGLRYHID